jgi:hypothetical protein
MVFDLSLLEVPGTAGRGGCTVNRPQAPRTDGNAQRQGFFREKLFQLDYGGVPILNGRRHRVASHGWVI